MTPGMCFGGQSKAKAKAKTKGRAGGQQSKGAGITDVMLAGKTVEEKQALVRASLKRTLLDFIVFIELDFFLIY